MPSAVLFLPQRLVALLRASRVRTLRAFAMWEAGSLGIEVYRVIGVRNCEPMSDDDRNSIEQCLKELLEHKHLQRPIGRSEIEILLDSDKEYRLCFPSGAVQ